jgi:hypothetical protein
VARCQLQCASQASAAAGLNNTNLAGLDFVLHEARKAGLRVILAFTDNWKYPVTALQSSV